MKIASRDAMAKMSAQDTTLGYISSTAKKKINELNACMQKEKEMKTMKIASRDAMAEMSAQDTTPGYISSTADLIVSIISNHLAELRFAEEVFSPMKSRVSSRSSDPSHPYDQELKYD